MRQSKRHGVGTVSRAVMAAMVAVTAATVLTALPVRAQTSAVPASLVTLDVRDARLENAVQLLTSQTGVDNVVFVNVPGKSFGTVTVKMEDQPFEKALRAMATSAMATVSLEDGIYYLRPRGMDDDVKPAAPAAPVRKRGNSELVQIPLQYLMPSTVQTLLQMGELYQEDPLKPKLEAELKRVRPADPVSSIPQPNVIPNGGDVKPSTSRQIVSEGASAGRDGGEDGAGQRGFGGQGGGGGGGFGGPGGGGGFGGPGGGQQGGGANGAGGFLPEGVDRIISYDATNTLLVQGDPEGIEELRSLIRFLDVAPKQVMIKVEFTQLDINDSDQFGIDWQFKFANNIATDIPSQGGSTPTITIAYSSGNAVANLRASLLRNTSNLIQSPIITTTNNTPASITFSTSQPVFFTQQVIAAGGIAQTTSGYNSVTAANGVTVTPHINGDNSISMGLAPQLQSFTIVTGPNGQTAPSTTTQTLTTYRRVQSGETIVLGGFITRQTQKSIQKVPVLSDLPIIGNLFTQTTNSVTGDEVLVFVTPTIIEDHSAGSLSSSTSGGVSP